MMSYRIFSWLSSAMICSLLLVAGCAPLGEEIAKPKVELEKQMPEAAAAEVRFGEKVTKNSNLRKNTAKNKRGNFTSV